MRRATPILAAVLVLVVSSSSTGARAAFVSADGAIAFRSGGDAADISAMGPDGGSVTNLTERSTIGDLMPAWAPDGRHIAYARSARGGRPDLYVMNANGSARQRLTQTVVPERDPAWSPDGTRIAYSARTSRRGPFRIFVINADGRGRAPLTAQAAGRADTAPAWSPDGTTIAFASDRDGGFPEIYLINVDGTGLTRLTSNDLIDGRPAWSPDGTRIALERCCADGTSEIYVIDLATRLETNLTATTGVQEFDPVFSPTGSRIAYVGFEVGDPNIDVWAMGADGGGQTRLTTHEAPDLSPSWQPLPECTITGTPGDDDLVGTDGDDVICALEGNDSVLGGLGNDLILGGPSGDILDGQFGNDLLYGEGGADTLGGGPGYDGLDGGPGPDTCRRGTDGAFTRQCE